MSINYQQLVDQLVNFIELRFGVYLDTIVGYKLNLERFIQVQYQTVHLTKLSIESLDKINILYGKGDPSLDFKECEKRVLHRRTQGEFKQQNGPTGVNYVFAIENCLSDIFNYWNSTKRELGFKKKSNALEVDDSDIFPVMAYMRELRNRAQHDLYPARIASSKEGPIVMTKALTSYAFPSFEIGDPIWLSEEDIEALVFEARTQLHGYLIPYINNFLVSQPAPTP